MDKICFAHVPKSAGTYVNNYIAQYIINKDFKILNFREQVGNCPKVYLTTHYFTPNTTAIDKLNENEIKKTFYEYKKQGWFFFSFVRDPRESICSLYSQLQDHLKNPIRKHPLSFFGDKIENFIKRIGYQSCLLPDYWQDYDFMAEFSNKNFEYFLKKYFGHNYKEKKVENKSSNKGYKYYCENNLISKETQKKIIQTKQYQIYKEITHMFEKHQEQHVL